MTDILAGLHPSRLDYPQSDIRPERVSFGELAYDDPYRWLEEDDDPAVIAWQSAQDDLTQNYLDALPTLGDFADRVRTIGETDDVIAPTFAGGRWF
ncbi:hypothetical protein LTR94_030313, partial [Friedmanniomyces endolithicus]